MGVFVSAESMTDSGALKVNEFLQVEGQEKVLAFGVVTDVLQAMH